MKVTTASDVRGIAIPSSGPNALPGFHGQFSNFHPGFLAALNNNNISNLKTMRDSSTILNVSSSCNSNTSNSSSNNSSSASSRYKTELCRPFEEFGTCKYGDKCQFAHGSAELRRMTRHPKYKTEPCKTFHTLGLCPYGHRCHFIHNETIVVPTATPNNGLGAANVSGMTGSRDSRAGSILFTSGSVSSTTSSSSSPSPPLSASPTGSFEADQLFDYSGLTSPLHHNHHVPAPGYHHHHLNNHHHISGDVLGSPTTPTFSTFPGGFHGLQQQFSPRLPIFNSFFPSAAGIME